MTKGRSSGSAGTRTVFFKDDVEPLSVPHVDDLDDLQPRIGHKHRIPSINPPPISITNKQNTADSACVAGRSREIRGTRTKKDKKGQKRTKKDKKEVEVAAMSQ